MPDEMVETSDEDNNTNNNTNVHFSNLKPRFVIIFFHAHANLRMFSETENTDYLSSSQNSPGDVISNFVNSINLCVNIKYFFFQLQ